MAVTQVKQVSAATATSGTTCTLTLASAPAADNLLIAAIGIDKAGGTVTCSDGFTDHPISLNGTGTSLHVFWKIADGSETSIVITTATSVSGNNGWYGEYEETAVSGDWTLLGSATTAEASTTAQSTGTTAAIAAAGRGFAFTSKDSHNSGTASWSNSYSVVRQTQLGAAGAGGLWTAEKNETVSTACTTTGTISGADERCSGILVFGRVSSGASITDTPVDDVDVTDAAIPVADRARSQADPVGVTDTTTPIASRSRDVADQVGVTDSAAGTTLRSDTPADSVGISDAASTIADRARTQADPVGVTDAVIAERGKEVTDPVGVSDNLTVAWIQIRTVTDSVLVTDSPSSSQAGEGAVTLNDPVGVSDTAVATWGRVQDVADSIPVTDDLTAVWDRAATVDDHLSITDLLVLQAERIALLEDMVGVTDLASAMFVGPDTGPSNFTLTATLIGPTLQASIAGSTLSGTVTAPTLEATIQ